MQPKIHSAGQITEHPFCGCVVCGGRIRAMLCKGIYGERDIKASTDEKIEQLSNKFMEESGEIRYYGVGVVGSSGRRSIH